MGRGFWGNNNDNGNGNSCGNGGAGMLANALWTNGAITRADLCEEFNANNLQSAVRGVNQGLCDGFYAMNTGMLNGFNGLQNSMQTGFAGVDNAICTLGYQTQAGINSVNVANMQNTNALQTQISDCCCQNRQGQAEINYNMATNTCNIINALNNNTRDIIDSQNAGTRAILDKMCQQELAAKDATIAEQNQKIFGLQLASSQDRQNALFTTAIANQTNQVQAMFDQQFPCPRPAYVVPNPNCCYGNPTVSFNSGCGCGNGYGFN